MVGAPASADAVARARRLPSLRVGLHLVLVHGRPLLPARELPDLVDARGCFREDMTRAGIAIFFRPAARRQLAAEIEAQFSAFAATGLSLDHVNAHKHFHLHPTVARHLIEIGRRYGMRAVRVPHEPRSLLRQIDASTPLADWLLPPYAALLRRRLRHAGVFAPDRVFGNAWSGALTSARVAALIEHLPQGSSELYTHPATSDRFRGSTPGYRYADELAALTATSTLEALRASGATLAAFSDFVKT